METVVFKDDFYQLLQFHQAFPFSFKKKEIHSLHNKQTSNHMKKLLILAAICFSTVAFAQSNKEDVDFIQSIYGKEKKTIIADFIKLEGAQKDAFWKLYDEYETSRKELGKKRLALLEKYAASYSSIDDATATQITKEMIKLGAETDKLIATYHKKMEKASGAKAAAQFYQIEAYFLSVIRASILESIPFIGELD